MRWVLFYVRCTLIEVYHMVGSWALGWPQADRQQGSPMEAVG